MSIILTYPIKATNENLALKGDQSVVAYYRVPNTPITITDEYKKEKHKIMICPLSSRQVKYLTIVSVL